MEKHTHNFKRLIIATQGQLNELLVELQSLKNHKRKKTLLGIVRLNYDLLDVLNEVDAEVVPVSRYCPLIKHHLGCLTRTLHDFRVEPTIEITMLTDAWTRAQRVLQDAEQDAVTAPPTTNDLQTLFA